jgi:uncharacterized membrane protein (DUF2068 family)
MSCRWRASVAAPERQAAKRPLPIILIALEKGISTLVLIAASWFAFVLRRHPGRNPVELAVALVLRGDPHNTIINWLNRHAPYVSPDRAQVFGIGLALWAAVFAAETIGVWLQARWGSLLVIAETAAFLPLQVWNIARHPRPFEFVSMPVNLAILGYLVYAYRKESRESDPVQAASRAVDAG